MKYLISLITINYNNADGLLKTIESVRSQELDHDIEYLIIDGGSSDDSVRVIENNYDKINYWVSEKDSGIYNAMNKGIKKSKGEYLLFLNSGDFFIDSKVLKNVINKIIEDDKVDIWYGDMLIENRAGFDKYIHHHPINMSLHHFRDDTINHQSSFIKRDLFFEIGFYPEYYKLASDYWFFLSSLIKDKQYRYMAIPVVVYDFTGLSALDGFKSYKNEQRIIWSQLIPKCVDQALEEIDNVSHEVAKYRVLTSYKVVRGAISLQRILQACKARVKNLFS